MGRGLSHGLPALQASGQGLPATAGAAPPEGARGAAAAGANCTPTPADAPVTASAVDTAAAGNGAGPADYATTVFALTIEPTAGEEEQQRPPAGGGRLKRAMSSLGSLQALEQALLRNSSLQNIQPTARWPSACFMLVCADGAPFLLGLPAAMASLGWAGGIIVLCIGFASIQYCATRLVSLHEHEGKRHRNYRDLARAVLGKRIGTWSVLPFLTTVNFGTCVMYLVVSGQALHDTCHTARRGTDGDGCPSLTAWTLVAGASQLLLVLLPDITSLTVVTAVGAATTAGYSVLATVGAAVHGQAPDVSYAPQGSPADLAFNAFSSLGAIFLLFGLTVLLDIQSTLAPVGGCAVRPMVKATVGAYCILFAMFLSVSVSGFWAFGSGVQSIVFQSIASPSWLVITGYMCMVVNAVPSYLVFAHSLFEYVELKMMMAHWTGLEYTGGRKLIAKRYGFRLVYVLATAGVAVCLPFMGQLMGLIGALGYVPLCFVLPCVMWLKVRRNQMSRLEVVLNYVIVGISMLVMALAAVGSVRSLIVSFGSYSFFS